jgi:hypothetical protein
MVHEQRINEEFDRLRKEIEFLGRSLTLRLGVIQVLAYGLLYVALKLT